MNNNTNTPGSNTIVFFTSPNQKINSTRGISYLQLTLSEAMKDKVKGGIVTMNGFIIANTLVKDNSGVYFMLDTHRTEDNCTRLAEMNQNVSLESVEKYKQLKYNVQNNATKSYLFGAGGKKAKRKDLHVQIHFNDNSKSNYMVQCIFYSSHKSLENNTTVHYTRNNPEARKLTYIGTVDSNGKCMKNDKYPEIFHSSKRSLIGCKRKASVDPIDVRDVKRFKVSHAIPLTPPSSIVDIEIRDKITPLFPRDELFKDKEEDCEQLSHFSELSSPPFSIF